VNGRTTEASPESRDRPKDAPIESQILMVWEKHILSHGFSVGGVFDHLTTGFVARQLERSPKGLYRSDSGDRTKAKLRETFIEKVASDFHSHQDEDFAAWFKELISLEILETASISERQATLAEFVRTSSEMFMQRLLNTPTGRPWRVTLAIRSVLASKPKVDDPHRAGFGPKHQRTHDFYGDALHSVLVNTFGAAQYDPNAGSDLLGCLIAGMTDGIGLRTLFSDDAFKKRVLGMPGSNAAVEWSYFAIGIAAILNQLYHFPEHNGPLIPLRFPSA
jgi:hypothetical protein